MFFYQRKFEKIETRTVKMRDDWGVLHDYEIIVGTPELSENEIAQQLKVDKTIVVKELR
jgi:hypothetical protein